MQIKESDLALSHAFLNAINSCLQGRYTRLNVCSQLGLGEVKPEELSATGATINQVRQWFAALWTGKVSLLNAETLDAEAEAILKLHAQIKDELNKSAEWLDALIPSLQEAPDDHVVKEIVSFVAERAYSREHYIRALIQYCEVFNNPEGADRWRQHLLSCQQEIKVSGYFFQTIKQNGLLNQEQVSQLVDQALLLPGLYRCQVQDFNMNESRRKGETAFAIFDFSPEQEAEWSQSGFAPQDAAYWAAHGFSANSASEWQESGFAYPGEAASWSVRGFEAKKASEFAVAGVNPWDATLQE